METKEESLLLQSSSNMQFSSDSADKMIPLSNENVVLRGMSLRNTEMIIGIVVYTGHETKIQMNTAKSAYKISKMMHLTN